MFTTSPVSTPALFGSWGQQHPQYNLDKSLPLSSSDQLYSSHTPLFSKDVTALSNKALPAVLIQMGKSLLGHKRSNSGEFFGTLKNTLEAVTETFQSAKTTPSSSIKNQLRLSSLYCKLFKSLLFCCFRIQTDPYTQSCVTFTKWISTSRMIQIASDNHFASQHSIASDLRQCFKFNVVHQKNARMIKGRVLHIKSAPDAFWWPICVILYSERHDV